MYPATTGGAIGDIPSHYNELTVQTDATGSYSVDIEECVRQMPDLFQGKCPSFSAYIVSPVGNHCVIELTSGGQSNLSIDGWQPPRTDWKIVPGYLELLEYGDASKYNTPDGPHCGGADWRTLRQQYGQ